MKTYLDCIPCFFRQALEEARIAGADESTQKRVMVELCRLIPNIRLNSSPAEMGRSIYQLIRSFTGKDDPYEKIKEESNIFALSLYPELKEKVKRSNDRLLTALKLAAAGNIIDYGVSHSFDIEKEIGESLDKDFAVFDYQDFKDGLKRTDQILYLGDNSGEIVFDKILIEELKKETTFVVRGRPIINDATIKDARFCGMNKVAKILSSGSDAPGTVLKFCSPDFLETYKEADFIISKGQGNFEALSNEKKSIFFILRAKCPVIAKSLGCKVGDTILKSSKFKIKSSK